MDWRMGVTTSYYVKFVDPNSWNDTGERLDIEGGSIALDDSDLRGSANFDCKDFDPEKERWVRIYMNARQEGGSYHGALFTGLACSPGYSFSGLIKSESIDCYSVLKPAKDVLLPLGWYAAEGSNGADLAKSLLSEVIPAPIEVEGTSPNIASNIVAEGNETYLSMVDLLLDAVDWRLKIDGYGRIIICEKASSVSSIFNSVTNDIVEMELSIEKEWFECPNVIRASYGDEFVVIKDEDPDSKFSVENRGREIWVEENIELSDDKDISQKARERLKELQNVQYVLNYTRRYDPDVLPSDFVTMRYPSLGINGIFRVGTQNITLGYNASVSETSYLEVEL